MPEQEPPQAAPVRAPRPPASPKSDRAAERVERGAPGSFDTAVTRRSGVVTK